MMYSPTNVDGYSCQGLEKQLCEWALNKVQFKPGRLLTDEDFRLITHSPLKAVWEHLMLYYHPKAADIRKQLKLNHFKHLITKSPDDSLCRTNILTQNQQLRKKSKQLKAAVNYHKELIDSHLKSVTNMSDGRHYLSDIEMLGKDLVIMKNTLKKLKAEKNNLMKAYKDNNLKPITINSNTQYNCEEAKETLVKTINLTKTSILSHNIKNLHLHLDGLEFLNLDALFNLLLQSLKEKHLIKQEIVSCLSKHENVLCQQIAEKHVTIVEEHFLIQELTLDMLEKEERISHIVGNIQELSKGSKQGVESQNLMNIALKEGNIKYLETKVGSLKEFQGTLDQTDHLKTDLDARFKSLAAIQASLKNSVTCLLQVPQPQCGISIDSLRRSISSISNELISQVIPSLLNSVYHFDAPIPSKPVSNTDLQCFLEIFPNLKLKAIQSQSLIPRDISMISEIIDQKHFNNEVSLVSNYSCPRDVINNSLETFRKNEPKWDEFTKTFQTLTDKLEKQNIWTNKIRTLISTWLRQPAEHCIAELPGGKDILASILAMRALKQKEAVVTTRK